MADPPSIVTDLGLERKSEIRRTRGYPSTIPGFREHKEVPGLVLTPNAGISTNQTETPCRSDRLCKNKDRIVSAKVLTGQLTTRRNIASVVFMHEYSFADRLFRRFERVNPTR
jgi:hypothetical protein